MTDDHQLLRRYAEEGSEAAFGQLVARYVDLVYSAALRRVGGNAHLAQDVSQQVFTDLARKARWLPGNVVLGGWLHRASRFAAAQLVRSERRRQARELQAVTMNTSESVPDWEQIRPLLDEALDKLSSPERDAVLLRFLQQRSLAEVGQALGINEDAARKRVQRALQKMRALLVRRGVATTSASLATAMAVNGVQVAPAGLAGMLTSASVATASSGTLSALTIFKYLVMTKLQLGVLSAVLVAGIAAPFVVEHQARTRLREQAQMLQWQQAQLDGLMTENERLAQLVAQAKSRPMPNLPAPPAGAATPPKASSSGELQATNLMLRLLNGEMPKLTPEQREAYLKQNHRNAASLLAIFRATGDTSLLREALEKYAADPRVNFAAALDKDATPQERRQRLDAFKQSASNNALPNYLSALDYFKSGQTAQAVQELNAALGKPDFQDYSWDFVQNAEEAWRSAGYTEAETKMVATWQLMLPHLVQLQDLNQQIVDLANAYRQSGDAASAQAALQMDINLGQQMDRTPTDPLVTQLVGLAIERNALNAMDPNSPYGTDNQTVKDQVTQLAQQSAAIKDLVKQMEPLQAAMSPQDWINYNERTKTFGEVNALRWLLSKYGQQ